MQTKTAHRPRPVLWLSQRAKVLVIGQAPGAKVHASGKPFTDPSGDRLRSWMQLEQAEFYDRDFVAIQPMAFCFPGYNDKGADLPPPSICHKTWFDRARSAQTEISLTLLVGGYAQSRVLGTRNVTETVRNWRSFGPDIIPLPHPSWRNTAWLKRNPWFEEELLPVLRERIADERAKCT